MKVKHLGQVLVGAVALWLVFTASAWLRAPLPRTDYLRGGGGYGGHGVGGGRAPNVPRDGDADGADVAGEPVVGESDEGAPVVGAPVVGMLLVGDVVVGAPVVGAPVVGAAEGASVAGESVVGDAVVGDSVVGLHVGSVVAGEVVVGDPVGVAPAGLRDRVALGARNHAGVLARVAQRPAGYELLVRPVRDRRDDLVAPQACGWQMLADLLERVLGAPDDLLADAGVATETVRAVIPAMCVSWVQNPLHSLNENDRS